MTWPAIPTTLAAPGGNVAIEMSPTVVVGDKGDAWGEFDPNLRRIRIDENATMRHKWFAYFHESTHVMLNDSGLDELLPHNMVEAICNASATARLRETFGDGE